MKDVFHRHLRAEKCLSTRAARHLVIEDERFYDAFNFAAIALVTPAKDELLPYLSKMNIANQYFNARYGFFDLTLAVKVSSDLNDGQGLLLWRTWLLLELEEGDSHIDQQRCAIVLEKQAIDQKVITRMEIVQAEKEGRTPENFFSSTYTPPSFDDESGPTLHGAHAILQRVIPALFAPEVAANG